MILNFFYKNQCESSSERVFREACTMYTIIFVFVCVLGVFLGFGVGHWDSGTLEDPCGPLFFGCPTGRYIFVVNEATLHL